MNHMRKISGETVLAFEKTIPASIEDVWESWTTEQGVKSFFAPDCHIEIKPGGAFEMFFNPEGEPGERGGEGCRILAIEKPTLLSFTWNFPPEIPQLRNNHQYTHVSLRLSPISPGSTLVKIIQDGWGIGEEWEKGISYFSRAWGEIVLPRLYERFTKGPISWNMM